MGMSAKALTIVALGCTVPLSGFALGIRLFDHDAFATARGDAFVATADNPSAIYYNPAGITQLKGQQVRGALNVMGAEAGFESRTLRDMTTLNDFLPLPGAFYTYSPEELPLSFGVGYYLPFGLKSEWPKDGPFRTTTTDGELQYHTLNPVLAWKVTETLSIAAGPTLNYAFTDLRRGIIPAARDEFKFTGDDFAYGFTAGLLWQPAIRHSFGISYRSPTTMRFEGESETKPSSGPNQDASMKFPLPQVIIAGYSFRPTPNWNLEVDVDWTDWERLNTPVLRQKSGNIAMPLNWKSSFAVEAGVTRYFDTDWHISGGYVFLENSVPQKFFTPLVPDQDLHVLSAGIGGVGGKEKKLSWDLTYKFTFGTGRDVSGYVYGPEVAGHYTFIAHAFSLSLGYRF
jgi:long-chain fatty acid transport protein